MTTDEMLLPGSDTNEPAEASGQRTPRSAAAGRFCNQFEYLNNRINWTETAAKLLLTCMKSGLRCQNKPAIC